MRRWPFLRGIRVRDIASDADGCLWFSTYSSLGLVRMDPATGEYDCFNRDIGLSSDYVRSSLPLKDGSALACCTDGLFLLKDGKAVRSYGIRESLDSAVLCLCAMPDGAVLAGSNGDGIFTFKDGALRPFAAGGVILSLCHDAANNCVWVLTGDYETACIRGGDFYDFFLIDDDHLAMAGAVSALPKEIADHVQDAVNAFVKDAPQFDDITMLVLKYNG